MFGNNYGGGGLGASGIVFMIAYLLNLKEERKDVEKAIKVKFRARPDFRCGEDFH
jgi:hypothetical protein